MERLLLRGKEIITLAGGYPEINLVSSLERYDPTFPKEARESDATELPRFYVRITITFRNLPKVLSSIRPAIV